MLTTIFIIALISWVAGVVVDIALVDDRIPNPRFGLGTILAVSAWSISITLGIVFLCIASVWAIGVVAIVMVKRI